VPMPQDEAERRIEQERAVCSMYIDSAKTVTQLGTGALVLSLAFATDFLGRSEASLVRDGAFVAAWVLWLLAILCGVTYEYCAIKYLENIAADHHLLYYKREWSTFVPKLLLARPYLSFAAMMFCFLGGIVVFTGVAVIRLFGSP
jgi:hypothetical protein